MIKHPHLTSSFPFPELIFRINDRKKPTITWTHLLDLAPWTYLLDSFSWGLGCKFIFCTTAVPSPWPFSPVPQKLPDAPSPQGPHLFPPVAWWVAAHHREDVDLIVNCWNCSETCVPKVSSNCVASCSRWSANQIWKKNGFVFDSWFRLPCAIGGWKFSAVYLSSSLTFLFVHVCSQRGKHCDASICAGQVVTKVDYLPSSKMRGARRSPVHRQQKPWRTRTGTRCQDTAAYYLGLQNRTRPQPQLYRVLW